jgi:drug/metabolite transporter (DMT)-like permease
VRGRLWDEAAISGQPATLSRVAVYPLLVAVVVILGINWPFLATGLESIEPIWMVVFRLVGGAVTVLTFSAATGRLIRPPRQDYPMILSVAVFRLALVFILVFTALTIVPPGRSSILTWTAALWTVPIAVAFGGEHMNGLRWLGLTVGIGGIILVFDPFRLDWTDTRVVLGHVMLLTAAILNSSVSVHVRRHRWASSPLALLPWQLLVATIPMLLIALITEGIPSIDWTTQLAAIVIYQGTLASAFALWGQLTVLRSLPAISTNIGLMGVPVVGLLASSVLVDEPLTFSVVTGLILVLAGVAVSVIADARVRRASSGRGFLSQISRE